MQLSGRPALSARVSTLVWHGSVLGWLAMTSVACGPPPMAATQTLDVSPAGSAAPPVSAAGSGGSQAASVTAIRHPLMGQRAYPRVLYPAENPDSEAKAMLGKILFWDEQLSGDDSTACGTCHRGRAGGSDPRSATESARLTGPDGLLDQQPTAASDDGRGSIGVVPCDANGATWGARAQVTGRKAPSAFDAMFSSDLFWDGRASRDFVDPDTQRRLITGVLDKQTGRIVGGALESQAIGPPLSEVEMACAAPTWGRVTAKLALVAPLALARRVPDDLRAFIAGRTYPELFAATFGAELKAATGDPDGVINASRIAFAMATYERRLTSDQTPWDRWNAGDSAALTERQVQGFEVFMGKANCQACHAPPLFLDLTFHYLGLHPVARDRGQGGIGSTMAERAGMMKTPTLRNVGLREAGGLTHQGDGPGRNLEVLLSLYRDGGLRDDPQIASLIDPLLVPLELSDAEIAALADFLRNGLTDPRVADEMAPFDRPSLRDDL
jgi:cytochrome c peroxidase